MNNTQLWVAVLIPTVIPTMAVLISIFLNNGRFASIEGRISAIEGRLIVIEGDLRRFYQVLGEHSARLDNLERKAQ